MAAKTQPDPGKTFGIIGFILAFVGFQLVGLILSIIGYNKSKKAGHKNGLALAGIILNSIALAIALILLPLITITAYNGITERANSNLGKSVASSAATYAEVYAAEDNGVYPTTFSQIKSSFTEPVYLSSGILTKAPAQAKTIEFYTCNGAGNKFGYWDSNLGISSYYDAGDTSSGCVLSTD